MEHLKLAEPYLLETKPLSQSTPQLNQGFPSLRDQATRSLVPSLDPGGQDQATCSHEGNNVVVES